MPSPSPGCLLKARAATVPPATNGNGSPRPGRAELPACYRRFDVPGVDLCCTWCGPATYPGCHFRRSWPCPAAERRWSFMRGTGLGGRGGCVLRADAVPALARGTPRMRHWSAESMSAAGAVCSRGSTARRARRGPGDGSTGTGKTCNLPGTGSPATAGWFPASPLSRPASACPADGGEGRRPGSVAGPGTVSRTGRPFSRVRQPAAIPRRRLICLLIRLPADSGTPFQWRTRWTRRE